MTDVFTDKSAVGETGSAGETERQVGHSMNLLTKCHESTPAGTDRNFAPSVSFTHIRGGGNLVLHLSEGTRGPPLVPYCLEPRP